MSFPKVFYCNHLYSLMSYLMFTSSMVLCTSVTSPFLFPCSILGARIQYERSFAHAPTWPTSGITCFSTQPRPVTITNGLHPQPGPCSLYRKPFAVLEPGMGSILGLGPLLRHYSPGTDSLVCYSSEAYMFSLLLYENYMLC